MTDLSQLDICFVVGTLRAGGSERQLDYVLRILQEAGARVRVVSLDEGEYWERAFNARGIPVASLAGHRGKAMRLRSLVAHLRRDPPQIIHAFHFRINLYAVVAARLLGCRDVGSIRGDLDYTMATRGRIYGPLSLRAPRLLVANSHRAARIARARGVSAERIILLPNVVDADHYHPAGGTRAGPFRILLVGRNVPEKRLDRFVRLVAAARNQVERDVQGVFVGERGSGVNSLDAYIGHSHLPPSSIEAPGVLDPAQVAAIYRDADLFVLTSDYEGTPNALLEAMASGLPCVSTACGDAPRLLADNRGRVVRIDDEDALLREVLRLIADDRQRAEIGRRARTYVEQEHSLAGMTRALSRLYSTALSI